VFVLSRELRAGAVESSELNNGPNVHRFGESKNLDFALQQSLNFLSWLDGSVIRHKLFLDNELPSSNPIATFEANRPIAEKHWFLDPYRQ